MKIFNQFEIINRLNECLCTLKKVKYPTVKALVMVTWITSDHYYQQNIFYCLPQINNTVAYLIAAQIIYKAPTVRNSVRHFIK